MYFFDLDGTLLDSNGVWTEIDRAFLGRFGVKTVPADYTEYVTHHNLPDSAAYTRTRYGLDLTEEEIMDTWRAMAREAYSKTLELKPDVENFLRRARAAGKRCAVLSASIPAMCHMVLERHGIRDCFEAVFTSEEVGLDKKDPELYREVARRSGLPPGESIFFDDSPVNCAAARAAGWQVYGVADHLFTGREEDFCEACGKENYPFSFRSPLP